uniref:Uncharacterized protein n=1 Tax=Lepeophtheirus salmonis TaxID=72036 RepID=A0A0K2TH31_LEPSM
MKLSLSYTGGSLNEKVCLISLKPITKVKWKTYSVLTHNPCHQQFHPRPNYRQSMFIEISNLY